MLYLQEGSETRFNHELPLVLPVKVTMPNFNLTKHFIYYVKSDIQYNIDAFLLSTGFRVECQDSVCIQNSTGCQKCKYTFLVGCKGDNTWEIVDLRKVVSPVEYICPNANLSFVQLDEADRLTVDREQRMKAEKIVSTTNFQHVIEQIDVVRELKSEQSLDDDKQSVTLSVGGTDDFTATEDIDLSSVTKLVKLECKEEQEAQHSSENFQVNITKKKSKTVHFIKAEPIEVLKMEALDSTEPQTVIKEEVTKSELKEPDDSPKTLSFATSSQTASSKETQVSKKAANEKDSSKAATRPRPTLSSVYDDVKEESESESYNEESDFSPGNAGKTSEVSSTLQVTRNQKLQTKLQKRLIPQAGRPAIKDYKLKKSFRVPNIDALL